MEKMAHTQKNTQDTKKHVETQDSKDIQKHTFCVCFKSQHREYHTFIHRSLNRDDSSVLQLDWTL